MMLVYHRRGARKWREEMEDKGYRVLVHYTCDNDWPYRPIRKKQGVIDAICQYPAGGGFPGKFLYAMPK